MTMTFAEKFDWFNNAPYGTIVRGPVSDGYVLAVKTNYYIDHDLKWVVVDKRGDSKHFSVRSLLDAGFKPNTYFNPDTESSSWDDHQNHLKKMWDEGVYRDAVKGEVFVTCINGRYGSGVLEFSGKFPSHYRFSPVDPNVKELADLLKETHILPSIDLDDPMDIAKVLVENGVRIIRDDDDE